MFALKFIPFAIVMLGLVVEFVGCIKDKSVNNRNLKLTGIVIMFIAGIILFANFFNNLEF